MRRGPLPLARWTHRGHICGAGDFPVVGAATTKSSPFRSRAPRHDCALPKRRTGNGTYFYLRLGTLQERGLFAMIASAREVAR